MVRPGSPPTASATRSAKRSWAEQVGRRRRRGDVHRQPERPPGDGKRGQLLGQAAAAEPEARVHVRSPDPRVRPDAREDLVDVRPGLLAQAGDLVRERQLEGEEGVGGVLDDLGRLDVDDEARPGERRVQREHVIEGVGVRVREPADDDPGRIREIFDCGALAQEFRVREGPARRKPGVEHGPPRPADRQRAADDDDVGRIQDDRELGQHSVDLAKVAQAVIADRRPDADEDDARCIRRDVVDGQPSRCDGRIEALLEPRFVDRDPPARRAANLPGAPRRGEPVARARRARRP